MNGLVCDHSDDAVAVHWDVVGRGGEEGIFGHGVVEGQIDRHVDQSAYFWDVAAVDGCHEVGKVLSVWMKNLEVV